MQGNRPLLNDDDIKRCHALVDELVKLHRETAPSLGAESEAWKTDKAYMAINYMGMISTLLTEWAESHILGGYFRVAESKEKWIDGSASNNHSSELMAYDKEFLLNFLESDDRLICLRHALAAILRNSFRRYGITVWRMLLSDSLLALNEGQIRSIFMPTNTNLRGDAYDIQNLKWAAIKHVYRLMGEGWKKTAAQQHLAEWCGVSWNAIKKWEKERITEVPSDRETLKFIEMGAKLVMEAASDGIDKNDLLLAAVHSNEDFENDYNDGFKKDLSFGTIVAMRLNDEYPVNTLKSRLIDAGIRSNKN